MPIPDFTGGKNPLINAVRMSPRITRERPDTFDPNMMYLPDLKQSFVEGYNNPIIQPQQVNPQPVNDAIQALARARVAGAEGAAQAVDLEAQQLLDGLILQALGPELFKAMTGANINTGTAELAAQTRQQLMENSRLATAARAQVPEIQAAANVEAAQNTFAADKANTQATNDAALKSADLNTDFEAQYAKQFNELTDKIKKLEEDYEKRLRDAESHKVDLDYKKAATRYQNALATSKANELTPTDEKKKERLNTAAQLYGAAFNLIQNNTQRLASIDPLDDEYEEVQKQIREAKEKFVEARSTLQAMGHTFNEDQEAAYKAVVASNPEPGVATSTSGNVYNIGGFADELRAKYK